MITGWLFVIYTNVLYDIEQNWDDLFRINNSCGVERSRIELVTSD